MTLLINALRWKYPGAVVTIRGGVLVDWSHPTEPIPTRPEQLAAIDEYERHLAGLVYRTKRAAEYPPVGDQLDDIFKALKFLTENPPVFTDAEGVEHPVPVSIGPAGANWLQKIQAIKDKYPKP